MKHVAVGCWSHSSGISCLIENGRNIFLMVITKFSFPEMNSNYSFSFKMYVMHSAEEQKGAKIKALIHCTLHNKSPFRNIKWINCYSFENKSLNDEFSYHSLLDHSVFPSSERKALQHSPTAPAQGCCQYSAPCLPPVPSPGLEKRFQRKTSDRESDLPSEFFNLEDITLPTCVGMLTRT